MIDIPSEVIWAETIIRYVKYVGEDTYNKVEEIILAKIES